MFEIPPQVNASSFLEMPTSKLSETVFVTDANRLHWYSGAGQSSIEIRFSCLHWIEQTMRYKLIHIVLKLKSSSSFWFSLLLIFIFYHLDFGYKGKFNNSSLESL